MDPDKKKILVVDDEVGVRDVLYNLLTAKGYAVTTVESGKRALEMLSNIRPDLIILDYRMPQMDGLETLKGIRKLDNQVLVIMLTAFGTPQMEQEAHQLGVNAFLAKDISVSILIKGIEKIVHRLTQPAQPTTVAGKVMVVDDEPAVCEMLSEYLSGQGHKVLTVNSGEEALKQLSIWNPLVVLLDIKMPGMDGLVCLQKMKRLNPKVNIIIMTGSETMATAHQSLALGASEFLMKPFHLDYLATAVWTNIITAEP